MIKFSVARLDKEPIELLGEEPPEFLELDEDPVFTAQDKVTYDLMVHKVPGGALVSGKIATKVNAVCGRCLEPITVPLQSTELELFFDLRDCNSEELDISEDLRDELLLNLPMNPLCKSDCRGLCPECGANLNKTTCHCHPATGSPAWSALDDLKL